MFWRLFTRRQRSAPEVGHKANRPVHHAQPAPPALDDCTFSVLDVETTGLFPRAHDRIVEIAVIRVGPDGRPLDEFATLINPERDLGPTHIHGITGREVLGAPRFGDIAGDVATRLADNVLVAHNARFDLDFLQAEFRRIGYAIPSLPTLCTMRLAQTVDPSSPSYRLAALCERFGVPLEGAHSALGDARATAGLLRTLLAKARTNRWRNLADLGCTVQSAPLHAWPQLGVSGLVHTRQHAASASAEPSYLARLVDRLPTVPVHHDPETLEYVDLLNRVLEDRRVTQEEAEGLLDVGTRWGLAAEHVRMVHHSYLDALVSVAVEDGVITEAERRDLQRVAELLGYDASHLDTLIRSAQLTMASRSGGERTQAPSLRQSLAGLSVCFTGELRCMFGGEPISRDRAEQLATEAGLTVKRSVSKSLDLLVVADPYSLSGKAQEARKYGIRIMAEEVFWRTLGIDVH